MGKVSKIKLVLELKKGSTEALQKLYLIYSKKIFFFIYSYIHNSATTEELVQDVFIKLWNNRENLKTFSSINNYIYTIAKNLTIDFLRKKKDCIIIPIESANESEFAVWNNGESQIISSEKISIINKTIENLSARKREVFKLQRFNKLTYKAISEKLEISVSAVEKNMSSALKEIKQSIVIKNIL